MRYAVITDTTVEKLYGKLFPCDIFSFPPGEASKTRATKEKIEDALLSKGYNKETTLIGLGGGVVTDLAGFLASTFCRGVDLILIPTTLMGMVDAAIGGKNGVNTEHGKNMIGTIYPPKKVIIDLRFLSTLPEKEMFNGTVEMLKAGLIADADYFHNFDQSIPRAIEIKRRIISRDLTEKGLRRLLNFGHTIGHALETLSNYTISHGEAVATGIVIESEISHALGYLPRSSLDLIKKRFPPAEIPFEPEKIIDAMRSDKKSSGGKPRFVLLKEIGEPHEFDGAYCREIPEEILVDVLEKKRTGYAGSPAAAGCAG